MTSVPDEADAEGDTSLTYNFWNLFCNLATLLMVPWHSDPLVGGIAFIFGPLVSLLSLRFSQGTSK